MEFEIDTTSIALPKEAQFTNTIGMILKTNGSLSVLKSEIFVKLKDRMKEILPLIKMDVSQEFPMILNIDNIHYCCRRVEQVYFWVED